MGSRKKIVNGSSTSNVYNQAGDKRELLYNRLSQDVVHGVKFGKYISDERLLGIYQYFSPKNQFIKTEGSIASSFDPQAAMADALGSSGYTIVSINNIDANDNATIVKADFSSLYPPTTVITTMNEYTNGAGDLVIGYALDNGYNGVVAKDNNDIREIVYTLNGVTYTTYFFVYRYLKPADDNLRFMLEPIKEDGKVKPNRRSFITMNRFGTSANSFKDSFLNDELLDLYYTFSSKASDPEVATFLDSIVGDNITIYADDNTTIEINGASLFGLEDKNWSMRINGTVVKDEDGDNVIMLPMEFFDELTLVQKYESVKKYLNLLSLSETEVEVKWYQTGIFKFLFGVVLAVVGYFTGQWQYLIGYVTGMAISEVFSNNPYISILIALITLDISSFTTAITSTLSIASSLVNLYVKYQFEEITSDIKQMNSEEREILSRVYSRRRQYLYEPISNVPSLYGLTYNSYSSTYDTMSYRNTERNHFGY